MSFSWLCNSPSYDSILYSNSMLGICGIFNFPLQTMLWWISLKICAHSWEEFIRNAVSSKGIFGFWFIFSNCPPKPQVLLKSQPKHAYFSIALLTFDVNIKKDNFVGKKKRWHLRWTRRMRRILKSGWVQLSRWLEFEPYPPTLLD